MCNTPEKEIGFGIVGLGMIARTHLIGMQVSCIAAPGGPKAFPAALCTRHPENAENLPFKAVYTSADELIADENVSVVDICTPNHLHAVVATAALRAGKAVYVEKPLSSSPAEAASLCRLAKEKGLPNQVAFVMRFRPDVNRMKDLVADGAIGTPIHFRTCFYHGSYLNPKRPMCWRQDLSAAGGGAVMDLGIHMLDLLRYVLDEEASVKACATRILHKNRYTDESCSATVPNQTDEYTCAMLETASGVPGILEASRLSTSPLGGELFEVFGTKGSLLLNLTGGLYLTQPSSGTVQLPAGNTLHEAALRLLLPDGRQSMGPFMDAHAAAINNIARMAAGLAPFAGTPGFEDGLRAQELVHACLAMAKNN